MATNTSDVVIAVMGPTGVGKSSFIQQVTGRRDIRIGHSLSSATEEVTSYRTRFRGINFVLVDTPGFDDSRDSDEIVLGKILAWLGDAMRRGTKLSGILYLHRIIDPKLQGTTLSNLRMFRRLCGQNFYENVVLATTFWGSIDPALGEEREKELRENIDFWGQLVRRGSSVARLSEDPESCRRLLLSFAQNHRIFLDAQKQMQSGKSVGQIAAFHQAFAHSDMAMDNEIEAERRRNLEEMRRRDQEMRERIRLQHDTSEQRRREAAQRIRNEEELQEMWHQERIATRRREIERQERELEDVRRARTYGQPSTSQEDPRPQEVARPDHSDCRLRNVEKRHCGECGDRLHRRYTNYTDYYHCCLCKNDKYVLCSKCGPKGCPNPSHPKLQRRTQSW